MFTRERKLGDKVYFLDGYTIRCGEIISIKSFVNCNANTIEYELAIGNGPRFIYKRGGHEVGDNRSDILEYIDNNK